MMSLQEAKLLPIITRQYHYKLKTHANLLVGLAIAQVIGLALSLGGMASGNSSTSTLYMNVTYYTSNMILVYTLIWAFVVGILLSLKRISNLDFAFISNRLSSNLANVAHILTLSVLGGLTTAMGSILLRCIILFGRGSDIVGTHFYVGPGDLLLTAFVIALYAAVLGMLGYLIGILVRCWRYLIVVLPALLIGILFLETRIPEIRIILGAVDWLKDESSLGIFVLKILVVFGLAVAGSVIVSQRMEVRK